MFDMIKKLQEAQRKMKEIKDRLETITVDGKSLENKVLVRVNGNRRILGITIADTTLLQNQDMLEDHIVMAVNNAIEQADKVNETEMKSAAGSMIPGLGGMFS